MPAPGWKGPLPSAIGQLQQLDRGGRHHVRCLHLFEHSAFGRAGKVPSHIEEPECPLIIRIENPAGRLGAAPLDVHVDEMPGTADLPDSAPCVKRQYLILRDTFAFLRTATQSEA